MEFRRGTGNSNTTDDHSGSCSFRLHRILYLPLDHYAADLTSIADYKARVSYRVLSKDIRSATVALSLTRAAVRFAEYKGHFVVSELAASFPYVQAVHVLQLFHSPRASE